MHIDPLIVGLSLVAILIAFSLHEWAHGLMAYQLGDPTPKYEGRLTPNPLVHLDPIGALVVLVTMVASHGGMVMGWAKPVQFDPDNLKNDTLDGGVIALAGPLTNFVLAFLGGLPLPLGLVGQGVLGLFLYLFVAANLGLGIFNCIPVPPLDGWKIVQIVVPHDVARTMQSWETRAGMWPLFGLLGVFWALGRYDPLYPIFNFFMNLFIHARV